MWVATVIGAVFSVSWAASKKLANWATGGNAVSLLPAMSFNLKPLTAAQPSNTKNLNLYYVLAGVGVLFGAGYLLRGVSALVKG